MGRIACSCFIAAFFSVLGDAMDLGLFRAYSQRLNQQTSFDDYKQLDPDLIQEDWNIRRDLRSFGTATGIVNAVSWILFCIPLFQTTWKLSLGGTHLVGLHLAICIIAFTSIITEFLSTVLFTGSMDAMDWIAKDFNLELWIGETSVRTSSLKGPDDIGWRFLELVVISLNGLILWVDAIEVLSLAFIMFLMFISIRRQEYYEYTGSGGDGNGGGELMNQHHRFNRVLLPLNFGGYCLFLSLVSVVDLTAEILRFKSWLVYSKMANIIKILFRLVLLPLWFLWLGDSLGRDSEHIQNMNRRNGASANEVLNFTTTDSSSSPAQSADSSAASATAGVHEPDPDL